MRDKQKINDNYIYKYKETRNRHNQINTKCKITEYLLAVHHQRLYNKDNIKSYSCSTVCHKINITQNTITKNYTTMAGTQTRTRPYKDALREAKVRSSQIKPRQTTLTTVPNRPKNKAIKTHSKTSTTGVKTRSQPIHTTAQKKKDMRKGARKRRRNK